MRKIIDRRDVVLTVGGEKVLECTVTELTDRAGVLFAPYVVRRYFDDGRMDSMMAHSKEEVRQWIAGMISFIPAYNFVRPVEALEDDDDEEML